MKRACSAAFLCAIVYIQSAAAQSTSEVELPSDAVAEVPATAEAPSDGPGPLISNVTSSPAPQPGSGSDIPIQAMVAGDPATVTLTYIVNYGTKMTMPMTAGTDDESAAGQFSAPIPSSSFKAGDMVRWLVTATDANQQSSQSPPSSLGLYGTVIKDPSVSYKIPVMEWFTPDVAGSTARTGANGSSIYFLGRFYDNIFVRRKGVTSLSWPKPKLKFKLPDSDFIYKPKMDKSKGETKVDTFDLNSLYYEPGQKSYMREAIAYEVLSDAGAVSALSFHIILRLNAKFYGLYTYVENDDNDYLKRNGLDEAGALIKATTGSSGLDFRVAEDQLQYNYEQQNHKSKTMYWPQLYALTQGIAGNTNSPRSRFVFDAIDLPATINTMAVLTMLLTQDRCTKNYLMYLNQNTSKWQMMAYDLKSALNADAGLGGKPAKDYCILECSQWNSPLYCDRDHPQDVTTNSTSPWTFISASSIGRRLRQGPAAAAPGPDPAEVNITKTDINLATLGNAPQGAAATFNYLIDLVTQVPATRQMYMRRLRTLTDAYYPTGKLAGMVTDMYNKIKEAAEADDEKWHIGDVTAGYQQLVQEQIPTRQTQLLGMYSPGGEVPLLPGSQPASPGLAFGSIDATSASSQQFIEIRNPLSYAVDVSNWKISGSAQFSLRPGTVIASSQSLIVAVDEAGFQQRTTAPMVGQGYQVVGPLAGNVGGSVQLSTDAGTAITSSTAPLASAG